MKLTCFILLCFIGLTPVAVSKLRTVHHKYHLIIKSYSWPMAQNYCRVMYTDLATIVTDDDRIQLNKEATSSGYTGSAWIGLYNDVRSWYWSLNGFPLKNVTYTNWYPGSPNNLLGNEACGGIFVTGIWGDALCTLLRPFICYNANFSGSAKFIGISTPLTWPQAQGYCRTHHTDLASSFNLSDNNLLLQLRDIQGDSWIGLYRDTWKWSDGTIVTDIPWVPGQPDSYYTNDNCAFAINEVFGDNYCSVLANFYCHTIVPAREQQIIKLRVKSDASVFDPVMQSSILEQLKKKLEEKGMLENTTVTWRVQPDGNIFQKKSKADV